MSVKLPGTVYCNWSYSCVFSTLDISEGIQSVKMLISSLTNVYLETDGGPSADLYMYFI